MEDGLIVRASDDITTILKHYDKGSGYTRDEMQTYLRFVHDAYAQYLATSSTALLQRSFERAKHATPARMPCASICTCG